MVALLLLLAIQILRVALILQSGSVMASFVRLDHLGGLRFLNGDLVVEDNGVYLIDAVRILVLYIIIWCSYNSSIFILFAGVIRQYVLIHQEVNPSTESIERCFFQLILLFGHQPRQYILVVQFGGFGRRIGIKQLL